MGADSREARRRQPCCDVGDKFARERELGGARQLPHALGVDEQEAVVILPEGERSDVADQQIKSVANFVAGPRELRRFCARNCARMRRFYSPVMNSVDTTKSRFPLVKRLFFETQRDVLKSTISQW